MHLFMSRIVENENIVMETFNIYLCSFYKKYLWFWVWSSHAEHEEPMQLYQNCQPQSSEVLSAGFKSLNLLVPLAFMCNPVSLLV